MSPTYILLQQGYAVSCFVIALTQALLFHCCFSQLHLCFGKIIPFGAQLLLLLLRLHSSPSANNFLEDPFALIPSLLLCHNPLGEERTQFTLCC